MIWKDEIFLFLLKIVYFYSSKKLWSNISDTRDDAQRSIFDEIRGVWKCDETLSRVFDVSCQSKLKLRNKQKNKIVKIYNLS